MTYNFKQRFILKKIEDKEITPMEGLKLLKEASKEDNRGAALYDYVMEEKAVSKAVQGFSDSVLVFCKDQNQAQQIGKTFFLNAEASYVMPGKEFEILENGFYTVRADEKEDYEKLLKTIMEKKSLPDKVMYFWHQGENNVENQLTLSGISISAMTQAYMECNRDRTIRLLFLHQTEASEINPVYNGLEALFQTINREDGRYQYKFIETDGSVSSEDILNEFYVENHKHYVSFIKGIRRLPKLQNMNFVDHLGEDSQNKKNGVYLIPGGAGGVGYLIAEYLARKYQATLVIAGRRKEQDEIREKTEKLKSYGGCVRYYSVDMCVREQVNQLVEKTLQEFGKINGVIYCAGMIQDAFLCNKKLSEMKQVIAAKLFGLYHLDQSLANIPLDYFAVFSSMSSVLGFSGQCDYAYANHIANYFAKWRSKKADRQGKTIAIDWSLWKDSSMGIAKEKREWIEKSIVENMGIIPMDRETGTALFEEALKYSEAQYIPIYGIPDVIKNKLFEEKKEEAVEQETSQDTDELQYEAAKDFVLEILEKVLNIQKAKIDPDATLKEYGIDSIMVNRFNMFITEKIKDIPQTLLFECVTIDDVIRYLVDHHKNELGFHKVPEQEQVKEEKAKMVEVSVHEADREIAVIGMDVNAPGADNTKRFWENLKNGKDVITEIPRERWDNEEYDPDNEKSNSVKKTYCKWGGFVSHADEFDANFFNISPREARAMDPQERLLLQSVWHAFEDAGYSIKQLNKMADHNVGVFTGVTSNTYMLWGDRQLREGREYLPQSYPWSVADRISYILDFHGPCMAVDTACSSSLTALHLACQSLKNEECEVAVAGGVNLILHPLKYIMQADINMLSKTGHCYTFGERADGYVPSEAICSLILKPYKKALEDKDMIYGVIKASAVNHGGTTTGYTVPNPNMQCALITKAYEKAEIDPRTISYVETHGTGTILGDPIEVSALTKAFRKHTEDKNFCGIGSVKSNMGHSESAAGVIAAAKVLLQLKHKQLVPSIHSEPVNSRIDFENSPFYVVDQLKEWRHPVISLDGDEKAEVPLRAGISSFGAGGSNAHVIMEEDVYSLENQKMEEENTVYPLFKISAKTKTSLKTYIEAVLEFIQNEKDTIHFNDFLYTVQTARMDFDERLAFAAGSLEDVQNGLKKYLQIESNDIEIFSGNVRDCQTSLKTLNCSESDDVREAAKMWAEGSEIDWSKLYSNNQRRRISIPQYPFETKKFWIDWEEKEEAAKKSICDIPVDFDTMEISNRLDLNQELKKFETETEGDEVRLEIIDQEIAMIHLENRKHSNMMTKAMYYMILKAMKQIEDTKTIKAAILTGYDNIFCMGGTEDKLSSIADKKEACAKGSIIYKGLLSMRIPVIAAMQGHAMGGGFIFGLSADMIVMAEDGMFSTNFMRYGFTPGVGTTYILKDKLGSNLSMEMMYSAREYTGQELKERGASFVFKPACEVLEEAVFIARSLAKNPVKSLEVLKEELSKRTLKQLPYVIESEVNMHGKVFTEDSMPEIKNRIKHFFRPAENSLDGQKAASDTAEKEKGKIVLNLLEPDNMQAATAKTGRGKTKRLSLMPLNTGSYHKGEENADVKKEEKKVQPASMEQKQTALRKPEDSDKVRKTVLSVIAKILRMDLEEIDTRKSFAELGVDSITGVEIIRDINKVLETRFETVITYQFSDINSFIKHVETIISQEKDTEKPEAIKVVEEKQPEENIPVMETKEETAVDKSQTGSTLSADEVEKRVRQMICHILRLETEEVDVRLSMKELGMDSVTGLELIRDINREYNLKLEAVIIYDYKDIKGFIQMIKEETGCKTGGKRNEEEELSKLLSDLKTGKMDIDQVDLCLEDLI